MVNATLMTNTLVCLNIQTSPLNRMVLRDDLEYEFSQLDVNTRNQLGHQLESMLLNCTFGEVSCDKRNFTKLFSGSLGNCFIFNSGWDGEELLTTTTAGPWYGLSLELFIEQDEYVAELTESAGVVVAIHSPTAFPFPKTDGLLVGPDVQTNLGITHRRFKREKSPYQSNCTEIKDKATLFYENVYSDIHNVGYTYNGCKKTCYQKYLYKECGCGDPQVPIHGKAFTNWLKDGVEEFKACPIRNKTIAECKRKVIWKNEKGQLSCNCTPACIESFYSVIPTTHQWPSDAYSPAFYKNLVTRNPHVNATVSQCLADKTNPGRHLVKLNIFYQELSFEMVVEDPSYTTTTLFSNLGGTLGLYLGLSFIALFEFVELLFGLCKISCTKKNEQVHSSD